MGYISNNRNDIHACAKKLLRKLIISEEIIEKKWIEKHLLVTAILIDI